MKRGDFRVALVLLALGALWAAPAEAAKSKKKAKIPAPVTVQATGSSSTNGQLLTSTVTCPAKMVVTGGGFSAPTLQVGGNVDGHFVYEARRTAKDQWSVSGIRADNPPAGDSAPLTAFANCRSTTLKGKKGKKKGKEGKTSKKGKKKPAKLAISEYTAQVSTGGGSFSNAVAQCPGGKSVVGGGFSSSPAPVTAPTPALPLFTLDRRASATGWEVGAGNLGAVTRTFAAYAYCAKGVGVTETSASSALPVTALPVLGSATATSPACTGKRTIAAGGFSNPGFTGNPMTSPIPLVTESAPVGQSWRLSAANLSTTVTGSITALAYCL